MRSAAGGEAEGCGCSAAGGAAGGCSCSAAGGAADTIDADVVLVAIGRVPYTESLGLDAVGVKKDNRGRVVVDDHFATNVPGIYLAGVICGGMQTNKWFIENSRDHGDRIVSDILNP